MRRIRSNRGNNTLFKVDRKTSDKLKATQDQFQVEIEILLSMKKMIVSLTNCSILIPPIDQQFVRPMKRSDSCFVQKFGHVPIIRINRQVIRDQSTEYHIYNESDHPLPHQCWLLSYKKKDILQPLQPLFRKTSMLGEPSKQLKLSLSRALLKSSLWRTFFLMPQIWDIYGYATKGYRL